MIVSPTLIKCAAEKVSKLAEDALYAFDIYFIEGLMLVCIANNINKHSFDKSIKQY